MGTWNWTLPAPTIPHYGTGLFTKALKIEIETDGRLTVAGKC